MPVIQLELDSKGAVSSLQKFDRAVDATEINTSRNFDKIKLGALAIGAAIAGAALVIGKASLEAAARMEEARNKYAQVFEGMTQESDKWVQNLRDNYALSEYAATEFLSSTKAILDGTKMQTEEAGKLANKVVLVAQDLASFHDKDATQAVNAMTSALTGEYEAMKQFGIVIKKAEIDQRAMKDNNLENKEALTQAMVAQAAYALMVEKSGKAIGDTVRSQDTYTFQLKQAAGLLMDIKVAIGEHLLPYAKKFLTVINDWVIANKGLIEIKLDEFFKNMGQMLKQLGQAALWTYERFVAFSNSLALFEAVGNDQLTWFEYATMNAKEAAEWLDKHRVVVEEDTIALNENKESNKELKTSLDIVNEATNTSISKFEGYSDKVKGATDNTKELSGKTKELAEDIKGNLNVSEKELRDLVKEVTDEANKSATALKGQASAAKEVASAVSAINDAEGEGEEKEPYKASKAWSGGSTTFKGSAFKDSLSPAEMAKYVQMTPAGRGDHYWDSGSPKGPMSGGGNTHSNLDKNLLQSEAAIAAIMADRWRAEGMSNNDIMMKQVGGGITVNNFNQQVSRSDISNITAAQITNGARA